MSIGFSCVQTDPDFAQVQDLITQTISLLNSTLSVPRGYPYSPGSFRNLMSKNFVDALIANANYAQNPANQKVFNANRNKILKNYKADQKRMAEEANRHKGAWKVVFGVGAVAWTAGKAYKAGGNGAKVGGPDNSNKYSLSGEEHYENLKDLFGTDNVEWVTKGSKYDNAVFADDEKLV